jgi:tetratricopeptide (TPR) repeat protein
MAEAERKQAGSGESPTSTDSVKRPVRSLSARRKWLFRVFAIVLGPVIAFGFLEAGLRIFGFGYTTSFFLDGTEIEENPVWMDNPEFGRWVFPRNLEAQPQPVPFVLPMEKAERTYRIFVLGESAAMGFPDPSISFARVLEAMLRASFPGTRFEVINASMVAINSHAILQIAKQCAEHRPDLFIVHLGNNEVVGPYGAAGVLGPFSPSMGMIRANLALKKTRSGQLLDEIVQWISRGNQPKQVWSGMAMFLNSQLRADDPRLGEIYAHFRTNLEDIVRTGRDAGAQVVLCTIPVNLKDSSPFGSMHTPGVDESRLQEWDKQFKEGSRLQAEKKYAEAIRCFEEADKIDPAYAEVAFRHAQCAMAIGQLDAAQKQFSRARDLDVLRFRTDSTINRIIREVASAHESDHVRLADAEQAFAQNDPSGVPGEDFFLEHVHMTFKGNYQLAKKLFETITSPALDGLGKPVQNPPVALTEEKASSHLAHTDWTDLKFGNDMYERLIQAPPFTLQFDHEESCRRWEQKLAALSARLNPDGKLKAAEKYEAATKIAKGDWMIRKQFGELLMEIGKYPEAEHQFREVLANFRHCWDAQYLVGHIELSLNHLQAAEAQFRSALKLNPNIDQCYFGLADALDQQGKSAEAVTLLEGQLQKKPKSVLTLRTLGRMLFRAGRFDEARIQFSRALELEPNNADIHVDLGVTAMKQKNFAEAANQFNAALKIRPDWPEVRNYLFEAEQGRK